MFEGIPVDIYIHVGILFLLPWLTYFDILKGDWVIDDNVGMGPYDGKLQRPVSVGNIIKKARWYIGRIPNPNKNWQQLKLPPHVNSPRAHHRLSLLIFTGVGVLLYTFLARVFSEPVAFLTTALFMVHPLGVQTAGWISGIGYLNGTFLMLLGFHMVFLFTDIGWMSNPYTFLLSLAIYAVVQWLAVEAQFLAAGACVILAYLGFYPFAILSFLISLYVCFNTFRSAISLRTSTFKEQQMERSTRFYPRKVVVVLKTFFYYVKMSVFPKRMGLYHPFFYHYEVPYVEWEDKYSWSGLAIFVASSAAAWFGPPEVKFAYLWFICFSILFLNWITAHQFVSERYIWFPSLAICLLVSIYFPMWAYCLVLGIAICRSWAHIPTYHNEVMYWLSNIWNFPTSEIAFGNIGVSFMSRGMVGSAMDFWTMGINVNPDYDVNWYNISSMFKNRGPMNPNYFPQLNQLVPKEYLDKAYNQDPTRSHLLISKYFLEKAINCKTCHFPNEWKKELIELNRLILPQLIPNLLKPLILETA